MIKFIQKLIKRQKVRKEAREAAYGALCEEQKTKYKALNEQVA